MFALDVCEGMNHVKSYGFERMQKVPQWISPTLEWMTKLPDDAIRYWFIHTVGLRAAILWHEVRPEELVPQREKRRVI